MSRKPRAYLVSLPSCLTHASNEACVVFCLKEREKKRSSKKILSFNIKAGLGIYGLLDDSERNAFRDFPWMDAWMDK